jgi:DNA polymerase III epsilon subunit-like protein
MIVLDIEASGLDAERDSILSIGALDLANPTNQFYDECRAWDGAHINDEALEVNGFSREEATDPAKKSEAELVRAFMAWSEEVANRTLAGQNPSFDRDYLRQACKRAGLDWTLAHRTIDSHSLAWMHMVKRGINPPLDKRRSALDLDAVLNYCGIPAEPTPHNALTGAMSHAEVISRLLYDEPLLDEFSVFPMPWKQKPS